MSFSQYNQLDFNRGDPKVLRRVPQRNPEMSNSAVLCDPIANGISAFIAFNFSTFINTSLNDIELLFLNCWQEI
jgi:hypothetical protein